MYSSLLRIEEITISHSILWWLNVGNIVKTFCELEMNCILGQKSSKVTSVKHLNYQNNNENIGVGSAIHSCKCYMINVLYKMKKFSSA